eukprot:snap_masked-scaffold_17-processed-gene-4.19-mRNA-1 protein AED:1.00 eAED:1.00 QI:0/0/0/0/1/1/2/0/169
MPDFTHGSLSINNLIQLLERPHQWVTSTTDSPFGKLYFYFLQEAISFADEVEERNDFLEAELTVSDACCLVSGCRLLPEFDELTDVTLMILNCVGKQLERCLFTDLGGSIANVESEKISDPVTFQSNINWCLILGCRTKLDYFNFIVQILFSVDNFELQFYGRGLLLFV